MKGLDSALEYEREEEREETLSSAFELYPSSPFEASGTEDKRTLRLIRNREAARRCDPRANPRNRLKKKDWIKNLQKANQTARELNIRLKEKVLDLENEFAQLQSIMAVSAEDAHLQAAKAADSDNDRANASYNL